ncbi:CYP86A7 [Symbiodinium natans]|uniref:CYP86A7 protein n=1 Tax=Symbiodinium natans TaxID=878477 RepID=A0A812LNI9_9DINO|nr:CYP86A7 [Symbiodinium natans]
MAPFPELLSALAWKAVEKVIDAHAKHMIDNKWVEVKRHDGVAASAGLTSSIQKATEEPELLGHEIENWAACLGGSTVSGREEVCSMEVMRKKTTLGSWPVSLEPTSLKQIPVPNSTWHDSPQRPDQPATNLNAEPSRNPKL